MTNPNYSTVTAVDENGTIRPTFNIDGEHTSGLLKYFSKIRGRKVKITVEILQETLDNPQK